MAEGDCRNCIGHVRGMPTPDSITNRKQWQNVCASGARNLGECLENTRNPIRLGGPVSGVVRGSLVILLSGYPSGLQEEAGLWRGAHPFLLGVDGGPLHGEYQEAYREAW